MLELWFEEKSWEEKIIEELKKDTMGRTDAQLFEVVFGVSISDKKREIVPKFKQAFYKTLEGLVLDEYLNLEFDYYFFSKDLEVIEQDEDEEYIPNMDANFCEACNFEWYGWVDANRNHTHIGWICPKCEHFNIDSEIPKSS